MINLEKFKINGRYASVPAALWDEFIDAMQEELDMNKLTDLVAERISEELKARTV